MELNRKGLENRAAWEEKGYRLPEYDLDEMIAKTKENPFWVHFGPGNLFRAFQANAAQTLLNNGVIDRGIVVAEGFDYEIVEKMNRPHDNLHVAVTLKADGTIEKTVVGSVAESCILDSNNEMEFERLKEIFRKDSLQMASFTITEKGYATTNAKGEIVPAIAADFAAGPVKPNSYLGKVVSLLYTRYLAGRKPIALVSMDNCSHNGDKVYAAVSAFADQWVKAGLAEEGFIDYINDKNLVSYPWSMIDKITPRPDASVVEMLSKDDVNLETVITSMKSYVAPFVNAEETEYLVIEDWFPNGRPELEKAGLMFTDRETVDKVERMKVCTCLNPLHTCLAVYGCILGYDSIYKEMADPQLKKLVETVGYVEGLPVVVNPGILDPKQFIDTVLNVRFPNPFMPDTPQRIATDTSQKLAIRFGETVKNYLASEKLDVNDLQLIPLVQAGWLRYLMGLDDNGNEFALSPDPLLEEVRPVVADVKLKEAFNAKEVIGPVLHNAKIWGLDLHEAGLADKVCMYFEELTAGVGAVRATLKKYVGE